MANYKSQVTEIVGRCRRIGWQVEMSDGGHDWLYRITCADGSRVQIHSSPSDRNWAEHVWRMLNKGGLADAEAAWQEKDEAEKKARLAAERRKADAKAKQLAERSKALVTAAGPYAGPQEVDLAWLLTPTQHPQSNWVVITPAAAAQILTRNVKNRKDSRGRIDYFKGLLTATSHSSDSMWRTGNFGATHQGGAIDWNGTLQDGQSRLQAIVETDIPAVMMWSIGMDPEFFTMLDTGGLRSAKDVAYLMGEQDPAAASAAAKMLIVLDRWGPNAYMRQGKVRISNTAVEEALTIYGDELRDAIKQAKPMKRELRRANPTSLAVGIFMLRHRMPDSDPRVEKFLGDVLTGAWLAPDDPVALLRRSLTNGPADVSRFYDRWEQLALVIKAWNFRATGQKRQSLIWRRSDPFPASVYLPPPIADDQHAKVEAAA